MEDKTLPQALTDALPADLLLHLVRVLCSEPMTAVCPRIGSGRVREGSKLVRAQRFASLCRACHDAASCFLRSHPHRLVDARSCALRHVRTDCLQALQIDHVSVPAVASLTTLSIHSRVSDASIAAALQAFGRVGRLRALALGCDQLGPVSLREVGRGDACSTLTALDLSGLCERSVPHLQQLDGCPALRRLELSHLSFSLETLVASVVALHARSEISPPPNCKRRMFTLHTLCWWGAVASPLLMRLSPTASAALAPRQAVGLQLTALALDGGLLDDHSTQALGAIGCLAELSLRGARLSALALGQLRLVLSLLRECSGC